jgi:hypothetical protein
VESSAFISKIADAESSFSTPHYSARAYSDEALTVSREALKELAVDKGEELRICTAAVLEKARKHHLRKATRSCRQR